MERIQEEIVARQFSLLALGSGIAQSSVSGVSSLGGLDPGDLESRSLESGHLRSGSL